MRIIIAGSRNLGDKEVIFRCISFGLGILNAPFFIYKGDLEIVSGGARGVDTFAKLFAQEMTLKYHEFPALWKAHGTKAGYLRNIEMAKYADALIAIWDGKSKGTKMMIDIAKKKELSIFVYNLYDMKWITYIGENKC